MAPTLEVDPIPATIPVKSNGESYFGSTVEPVHSKVPEKETLAVQYSNKNGDISIVANQRDSSPGWLLLNHVKAFLNEPVYGATKLRKMLFETNELIVCPGVYDGLSARTAIELGFNALYMVCTRLPESLQVSYGVSRLVLAPLHRD